MVNISELVEEARERKEESVEEFLQISIGIQHNFISIIEDDWERYGDKEDIEGFIDYSLRSIPNSAIDSIVIAIVNEGVIYEGYAFNDYEEIDFIDKLNLSEPNEIMIHGSSEKLDFGESDRFYYTATHLGDDLIVVVGFLEDVMYNQFISSLDLDVVKEIEDNATKILYQIFTLMIFIIGFGSVLLWEIVKLGKEFSLEEVCNQCNKCDEGGD